ncbi:MAG TPA: F0F1 ATP synthase subunit B [Acidimicrobiia bacterium]|nr:F0F1 ATP synthase subunit B [Acidimicrobiia bacterium]
MRFRATLAALAAVGLALFVPSSVHAQEDHGPGPEVHLTEAQLEELIHQAEETSDLDHHTLECVAEQAEHLLAGEEVTTCEESPNPILPETNEVIWAIISFAVLFVLLAKFAFPAIRTGLENREKAVRDDLEAAEAARQEAEATRSQYQAQLADARNEAARIIEEARQAADAMRREVQESAEAEAAAARERAQAEIEQSITRARADLQRQVANFAVDLAERVVGQSLDRDAQLALVDQYINEVGGMATNGGSR